jgi:hypothetical protein
MDKILNHGMFWWKQSVVHDIVAELLKLPPVKEQRIETAKGSKNEKNQFQ